MRLALSLVDVPGQQRTQCTLSDPPVSDLESRPEFPLPSCRSQIFQHFIYRDAQPAHARFSAPFVGINSNVLAIVHKLNSTSTKQLWSRGRKESNVTGYPLRPDRALTHSFRTANGPQSGATVQLNCRKTPNDARFREKSPLFSIALFSGADFFDSLVRLRFALRPSVNPCVALPRAYLDLQCQSPVSLESSL
jgi:hypothetical protein